MFDGIVGQSPALDTLTRALESGRLHHAYRFEGPDGVGKERAAFAFAQALICREKPRLGCGTCSACRRAVTFSEDPPHVPLHPDVVLIQRGLYPPSVLGRTSPEVTGIGVEQIRRVVLARNAFPPHEAPALVFIFRAAHELTASAANALLKTLEEPQAGTHFLLLSDQPRRLLDTVRSRTLPIRFGPLSDAVIGEILRAHGHEPEASLVTAATGSARRALELCEPERVERGKRFVDAVLASIAAPDLGAALQLAASEHHDRETLAEDLGGLAHHFAVGARNEAVGNARATLRHANSHAEIQAALHFLERNAPPALTLEALIARLRRQ